MGIFHEADVDDEIYDDCSTLPNPKPPIMEKPQFNNILEKFGGKTAKDNNIKKPPVSNSNSTGPAKFVPKPANKSVNGSSDIKTTVKLGAKPGNDSKPVIKIGTKANNESKPVIKVGSVNESKSSPTANKTPIQPPATKASDAKTDSKPAVGNSKPGGRLSIPDAFNKPAENVTDFRSLLKPTGKKLTNGDQPAKADSKSQQPKSINNENSSNTNSIINNNNNRPLLPTVKTSTPIKSVSSKDFLLSCDHVKYRLKNKPRIFSQPPRKPAKLTDVDLRKVPLPPPSVPMRNGEKSKTENRGHSQIAEYNSEEEDEDLKTPTHQAPELPARTFTVKQNQSFTSPSSVSSQQSPSSGFGSGSGSFSVSEGETYSDCTGEVYDDINGEIYEDVDSIPKRDFSIAKKEDAKKEQERKEKKEREKREKEEKEKQKKIEKEKKKEKDMLAKFKITGDEVPVAEGKVRDNTKGVKLDLAVKKGESISIIRMTDCPPLKWLAKLPNGKVGYVDTSNIEVDTQGIRDIMTGTLEKVKNARDTAASGVFEEVYDDAETLMAYDEDIYEETG